MAAEGVNVQVLRVRPAPGPYALVQSSQLPWEGAMVISSILQMDKQRWGKVK